MPKLRLNNENCIYKCIAHFYKVIYSHSLLYSPHFCMAKLFITIELPLLTIYEIQISLYSMSELETFPYLFRDSLFKLLITVINFHLLSNMSFFPPSLSEATPSSSFGYLPLNRSKRYSYEKNNKNIFYNNNQQISQLIKASRIDAIGL